MQPINNKEEAISKLKKNDINLSNCSVELQNDYDVVIEAVLTSGDNLEFASNNFKSNKGIILEAIQHDVDNFKFSSDIIKNDKEFILDIFQTVVFLFIIKKKYHEKISNNCNSNFRFCQ